MQLLHVRDAMQPLPRPLGLDTPLNEAIARLGTASTDGLPVVDEDGRYRGTVGLKQVEQAMRENALDASAGGLAQDLPALRTGQSLEEALGALLRAGSGVPVIDPEQNEPVGWLTHLDVLHAYNARLREGVREAQRDVARAPRGEPRQAPDALARLRGYRIVELELATSDPPVGRRIAEIHWPPHSVVLAICRDEESFEPRGSERLERGDRLTVLVPSAAADGLVEKIADNAGATDC